MAWGPRGARRRTIETLCWGLLAVIAVTFLARRYRDAVTQAELIVSDLRIYNQPAPKATGVVAIARVDDKSIAELGRFPWPRSVEARLVDALAKAGAKVVGFDIFFSERDPTDIERQAIASRLISAGISKPTVFGLLGTNNDNTFADAARAQGSTYIGYPFSSHVDTTRRDTDLSAYTTKVLDPPPLAYNIVRKSAGAPNPMLANAYLPPIPILNQAVRGSAYVDIDEDIDGEARSYPTVINFKGRYCVPLFLALVDAFVDRLPLSLDLGPRGVRRVAVGAAAVPVDQQGKMMVYFRGKVGTLPHYSVADIIDGRVPRDALKGKIVIVGVTAHGLGDRFATPVGKDFPGVEIQANAADNVLAGDFIYHSLDPTEEEFAGWIFGIAISVAAAFMTALSSAMVLLVLLAGHLAYATWRLTSHGTLIGVVFPWSCLVFTYLVITSYRYITEGLEKHHLRQAFEHYLNPDVVASVVDNPEGLRLGGERRHLSILFADIVNFTSRAERSDPEPLVALLNTYMTAMVDVILKSGGVLDKLMGDGIMAFWGAPQKIENPAREALTCALQMLDELKALAGRDERFHDVDIGIGITTGEAVVGNFGGERRFDYSVIGDTVNLASRLEGLTRQFKIHLLVNRETYEEAGAGFIGREIGKVKVKGKDQLVSVVEVAGREGDSVDPNYYQRFAQAMARLSQGNSPENELAGLLRERPNDHVVAMCLEQLREANGRHIHEMVFEFDRK